MHFGGLWLTFNIAIFQGRFPWFVWFLQKITLQQMLPYLSKCCKWYIKTERGLVVNVSVVSCPADVDRFRERFLVRLLSNMQHLQLHHWHHPYGTNSWSLLFLAGSCCQLSKSPYYPRVVDEDFTLRFFPNSEGGFNVVLGAVTSMPKWVRPLSFSGSPHSQGPSLQ